MIEQILVMSNSGLPLFEWSYKSLQNSKVNGSEDDTNSSEGNLLSGFFSALNMFAEGQKGERIKEITLKETTFIFQQEAEMTFIISSKDKTVITLMKLLLEDIRKEFLIMYPTSGTTFNGYVKQFDPFKLKLQEIFNTYNYMQLVNYSGEFFELRNIKSIFLVDRINGDPIFTKAQHYSDREILTFQIEIVLKAANRLLKNFHDKNIDHIVTLSKEFRSLVIRPTEKTILIIEGETAKPINNVPNPIPLKKIQKRIRSPGKLLFENNEQFFIIDPTGKIKVTNLTGVDSKAIELGFDMIPIRTAIEKILSSIYRDSLFNMIIVGENNDYLQFNLDEYTAIIVISQEKCGTVDDLIDNVIAYKEDSKNSKDLWKFECIFNKIHEFYEYF